MAEEIVERHEHAEVDEARKRTKVWKHKDREYIEALMRRGKSAWWIERWLEECYPTEQEGEDGEKEPTPDADANKKLHLSEALIEEYRADWLTGYAPGVDAVVEDLDEIVGRHFPGFEGSPPPELEVLDMALRVSQHNLAKSLDADEELGMVQETTLNAQGAVVATAAQAIEVKQSLGVPGYEKIPEHHIVDTTSRNVNVDLQGRIDPKTGERGPTDPDRVATVRELLDRPKEEVDRILAAATVIEGSAEEVSDGEAEPGEFPPEA